MTILVTGGAGFIGANFILEWMRRGDEAVVNLDALTYAGNPDNLASLRGDARYEFVCGDIKDRKLVDRLLGSYAPRAVVHFAAESHVDRSIHGPHAFIQTNVCGTFALLEAARTYWGGLRGGGRNDFRFLNVSTDEVYGSLGQDDPAFTENSCYRPNSPYSASKAAADHLARAWHHTYGLPVLVSNCSNNYGPRQFPEKLIPLAIANALAGKPLPVYGDGLSVRDWLYVGDHCAALQAVLEGGVPGQVYNIGGRNEMSALDVVKGVCGLLDELHPDPAGPYSRLIAFVKDRPGHDRRYAINPGKAEYELAWRAVESFESGLRKTVEWYLANRKWTDNVQSGACQHRIVRNYGARG